MNARTNIAGGSLWRELRGVMLLLLLAVAVPAACLLWFMSEAANNERLAVRQKLTELYGAHLDELQAGIDAYWERKLHALGQDYSGEGSGERFARLVEAGGAHSVVVYDPLGSVLYPVAAEATNTFSDEERAVVREARALRAELVSCMAEGDALLAIAAADRFGARRYADARDDSGRLIAPSAQMLALQHPAADGIPKASWLRGQLAERLQDYRDLPAMPSGQRSFLMGQLRELDDTIEFPTLSAERLAQKYLEADASPAVAGQLARAADPLWHLALPDRSLVAIYSRDALAAELTAVVKTVASLPGVAVEVHPAPRASGSIFLRRPAGRYMPGWELQLSLDAVDPFVAAASRKIGVYIWTGLLAIVIVAALATWVAGILLRQVRLTRLKNDFVATVSHELKTPLASMRVLVDTLLEGRTRDEQQAAEYLRLIARENERLSRLIDNFLSFSRMERNKRAFDFENVAPGDIVNAAVEAVRERFASGGCALEHDCAPGIPDVIADRDAMITVLLNLLDNAYKYSQDEKRVTVRAYAETGRVVFAVSDRGIGLARRESRRILERFYQVDRTLSRKTGGCGLGLSIVKFIVDAHHGWINIESQPGKGSTFTVGIPVAGTPTGRAESPTEASPGRSPGD